ncbi:MAG: sigma-70 family RNA polymerase sigma factor [Lachnospiraceae bacterium]|nr:sigma-70 family RNA polymerase sigma factor [Lachnospiraceae bacterium]
MDAAKITPNTSYAELKAMVPDVSDKHTPDGKNILQDKEQEVLIKVKEDGHTIIVYKSGFFAYIDDQGNPTARAVHNCSVMYFPDAYGNCIGVPVEKCKDKDGNELPFTIVLSHFGERNIEDQIAKKNARKQAVSVDGEHKVTKELQTPDFADALCDALDGTKPEKSKRTEGLINVVKHMTEAQIEVAKLYYGKNKSQKETAAILGISDRGVRYHLEAIEKKLAKYGKTTS